jgi:hypothetical protein
MGGGRTGVRRKRVAKPVARKAAATVRTTLTFDEFERARTMIGTQVARSAKRWGAHGWAAIGSKSKLRIEISIIGEPPRDEKPLRLPRSIGGAVQPMFPRSPAPRVESIAPLDADSLESTGQAAAAVPELLAPGSRILVDSRPIQMAGIACVVVADGDTYLVTCGHVFEPGATTTGVFVGGAKIAVLAHNFLEDSQQLDAAYCKLTPKGLQFLAASTNATTWYADILSASNGQNRNATFFPTNPGAGSSISTKIASASASDSNLFNDFWSLSLTQLIQTEQITSPGDSGSLLAVGAPSWSYYTPLSSTIERMRSVFTEVQIWQPGS